jgi:hypothetical protein
MELERAAAGNAASAGDGTPDVDEVRARHPERVIRREGFTWVAVDPEGVMEPLESARLDFLDALLDETGQAR